MQTLLLLLSPSVFLPALQHLISHWDSSHSSPLGGVSDLLSAVRKKLLQGREQNNYLLPTLAHTLTHWPLTPQFAELTGVA